MAYNGDLGNRGNNDRQVNNFAFRRDQEKCSFYFANQANT